MDERELAQALEASRDDFDVWGDPEQPEQPAARKGKSEKRQRGVVVSVRLTPAEFESIQQQAQQVGQTMSGYLRQRAVATDRPASSSWPRTIAYSPAPRINPQNFTEQTATGYVPVPLTQV